VRGKNIVLISLLVLNLAQYNLWRYIQHNFFYKAETVQYLLMGGLIYSLLCKVEELNQSKKLLKELYYSKLLTFLWIIFGMNDLCDLLFFDPNKFGCNEIAFTGLAFLYTIGKLRKQWKTNHKIC